ncbi:hypothetical protein AB0J21_31030 [Streptomyces sp. NPDC049954]|uniref:hypothetical protein n=1 Tax=Streptomyces sp. NPDC049954 TaxID=3155779 RepID=UPI00341DC4D8
MATGQGAQGRADEAVGVLAGVERARAAARAPRAWPGWFGPSRGLLAVLVFGTVGLPWPEGSGTLVSGVLLASAAAFVAVHYLAVRQVGVVRWPPPGTAWQRLLPSLWQAGCYGAGWLLALPLDRAAGAVASGVLLGAFLWGQVARHNRRVRRGGGAAAR